MTRTTQFLKKVKTRATHTHTHTHGHLLTDSKAAKIDSFCKLKQKLNNFVFKQKQILKKAKHIDSFCFLRWSEALTQQDSLFRQFAHYLSKV
jgi:hypothetical protein